jgi:hypothetical protein
LKNRKSSLKQKKKKNRKFEAERRPYLKISSLIETIYQSLLTYLKKLYEKLPGKNKTNPKVKLSLET